MCSAARGIAYSAAVRASHLQLCAIQRWTGRVECQREAQAAPQYCQLAAADVWKCVIWVGLSLQRSPGSELLLPTSCCDVRAIWLLADALLWE